MSLIKNRWVLVEGLEDPVACNAGRAAAGSDLAVDAPGRVAVSGLALEQRARHAALREAVVGLGVVEPPAGNRVALVTRHGKRCKSGVLGAGAVSIQVYTVAVWDRACDDDENSKSGERKLVHLECKLPVQLKCFCGSEPTAN